MSHIESGRRTGRKRGAIDVSIGSFAKGWYDNYFGSDENSYSLEPSTRRERGTSYFLDEEVSLDILNKGTLIQKRDAKSILFLKQYVE